MTSTCHRQFPAISLISCSKDPLIVYCGLAPVLAASFVCKFTHASTGDSLILRKPSEVCFLFSAYNKQCNRDRNQAALVLTKNDSVPLRLYETFASDLVIIDQLRATGALPALKVISSPCRAAGSLAEPIQQLIYLVDTKNVLSLGTEEALNFAVTEFLSG
jgi:hypothetical protein